VDSEASVSDGTLDHPTASPGTDDIDTSREVGPVIGEAGPLADA